MNRQEALVLFRFLPAQTAGISSQHKHLPDFIATNRLTTEGNLEQPQRTAAAPRDAAFHTAAVVEDDAQGMTGVRKPTAFRVLAHGENAVGVHREKARPVA